MGKKKPLKYSLAYQRKIPPIHLAALDICFGIVTMIDFVLTGRLLFLCRATASMFLFHFKQLVQVGHFTETYKWHPGGLGSHCKEVSYFLLTKNRQEEGGVDGMELNLAAEKRVYKITSILPHNDYLKKRICSQDLQNLDHFIVYIS